MRPERESRPAGNRAASESFDGDAQILPPAGPPPRLPVAGVLTIDLRSLSAASAGVRVLAAVRAPRGTQVEITVARGLVPPAGVVAALHKAEHLGALIVRCSDPATLRQWLHVLRGGYLDGSEDAS